MKLLGVLLLIVNVGQLTSLGQAIGNKSFSHQGYRRDGQTIYEPTFGNGKYKIIIKKSTETTAVLKIFIKKNGALLCVESKKITMLATLNFKEGKCSNGSNYLLLMTGGNREIEYKIYFSSNIYVKRVR